MTDRDRRTDRRPGKNNMSPDPKGGDIMKGLLSILSLFHNKLKHYQACKEFRKNYSCTPDKDI